MGIPGIASTVWRNRDKLSTQFECHADNKTHTSKITITRKEEKKNDVEPQIQYNPIKRTKDWIIFDAFAIVHIFLNPQKFPFMDFFRIKKRINEYIQAWLQCGFKLIFVFDGYKSWIKSNKTEETLSRNAERYRQMEELNIHLTEFHENYDKKLIKTRYDVYNDEKKENEEKQSWSLNWCYKINPSLFSGITRWIVALFDSFDDNKDVFVWNTKSEADQQIAGYVKDHSEDIFGIVSGDSDFFVFDLDDCDVWIIDPRSIKYQLNKNYGNKHRFNHSAECPWIRFVATRPQALWKYFGLDDNFNQRLAYAQIVGCDITTKKDPKRFVEEFDLSHQLKDVTDRNEVQMAISNIVKEAAAKDIKINEEIVDFYKFKKVDLCSCIPERDELLTEKYHVAKYSFESISNVMNDNDSLQSIHISLKPVRQMLYKRYLMDAEKKIDCITEYKLMYNHNTLQMEMSEQEIKLQDVLMVEALPYFKWNCDEPDEEWHHETSTDLFQFVIDILNKFSLLKGYENKGAAMLLQVKWRTIYTLNGYDMKEDENMEGIEWDFQNAITSYRKFCRSLLPKPIDVHFVCLFLKCIHYVCWETKIPGLDVLFCGPLYHFICQHQDNDMGKLLPPIS